VALTFTLDAFVCGLVTGRTSAVEVDEYKTTNQPIEVGDESACKDVAVQSTYIVTLLCTLKFGPGSVVPEDRASSGVMSSGCSVSRICELPLLVCNFDQVCRAAELGFENGMFYYGACVVNPRLKSVIMRDKMKKKKKRSGITRPTRRWRASRRPNLGQTSGVHPHTAIGSARNWR
jgi:hypothetical protein